MYQAARQLIYLLTKEISIWTHSFFGLRSFCLNEGCVQRMSFLWQTGLLTSLERLWRWFQSSQLLFWLPLDLHLATRPTNIAHSGQNYGQSLTKLKDFLFQSFQSFHFFGALCILKLGCYKSPPFPLKMISKQDSLKQLQRSQFMSMLRFEVTFGS